MVIPMLKIRQSRDRIVPNMGIPIPGKDSLYIKTGACLQQLECQYSLEMQAWYWNDPCFIGSKEPDIQIMTAH